MSVPFKVCSLCRTDWRTVDDFTRGEGLRALGLVVDFADPYRSLLLFNHTCGTTLAIEVESFRAVLPPLTDPLLAGQESCPRRCLNFADHETCPNTCRNAPLRKLLASLSSKK